MARKLTFEQKVERAADVFRESTRARSQIAQRAYDAQDKETQDALDMMADRIVAISQGLISVKPDLKRSAVTVQIEPEFIRMNALYLATEIVKDLALMDIRVANYRFPKGVCVKCGEPLKKKSAKKTAKKKVKK